MLRYSVYILTALNLKRNSQPDCLACPCPNPAARLSGFLRLCIVYSNIVYGLLSFRSDGQTAREIDET
jgi:hypothetical protein